MAEFYYLVSSLPFLRFHEDPPLSHSVFSELCAMWLDEVDRAQLGFARLDIEHIPVEGVRNGTLQRWILFENSLRNELVRFRAQRLGLPPEAHLRTDLPWDPSVVAHVRELFEEGNPLEAETTLLEMRWRFLCDLEAGHYFDLDALIIYALKVQILERRARFDDEKGREILQRVIEVNLGHEGKHGLHNGRQR